ncbi:MAG: glycosyltransferase family 2 protein [Candidatus Doudnabacteria bacterium]|nr:glycosyltransferase family 2 protein [Candidatus Doudnabacteria bacterium]
MPPLISIIILSYESRRYIERCLDSVFAQSYPSLEVLFIINGNHDGSAELVSEKYGARENLTIIDPRENLWFSRGNNLGIARSRGKYVLTLNQDTILMPDTVAALVAALEADSSLGSVSGKLLHYNYELDSKTRILDSTGIEIFKTHRVIDRGQWEQDRGQYDRDLEIFGASGAAAMYRRSSLEQTKIPKKSGGYEYFDENFIAYKEDVDLAWRLQLAGFGCRYVPEAIIYHGRTVGRSWPTQFIRFIINRRRQSRIVRQLSYKNHYLMVVKNFVPLVFWLNFPFFLIREILLTIYTVLFEPFQVMALKNFFRELPDTLRKHRFVRQMIRIDPVKSRKIFH